jgi:sugar lactone lactonase YvrE
MGGNSDSPPRFNAPSGLAFDGVDTLLVAEYGGNHIRKVSISTGTTSTFVGSGDNASVDGVGQLAKLGGPTGIAFDNAGNLYVSDYDQQCIRRITPAGAVKTIAGMAGMTGFMDGIGAAARFYHPNGMTFDGNKTLYISDAENNAVRTLDVNSLAVGTLAGNGTGGTDPGHGKMATFASPHGIAFDRAMNVVYVTDINGPDVRMIDLNDNANVSILTGRPGTRGIVNSNFATSTFASPQQLSLDNNQRILYLADNDNQAIRKLDLVNSRVTTYVGTNIPPAPPMAKTQPGPLPGFIHGPWGVLTTPRGLFMTSIDENTVLVVR